MQERHALSMETFVLGDSMKEELSGNQAGSFEYRLLQLEFLGGRISIASNLLAFSLEETFPEPREKYALPMAEGVLGFYGRRT